MQTMRQRECYHIIRHAITPDERKQASEALEYARQVKDSQGIMLALARLSPCQ